MCGLPSPMTKRTTPMLGCTVTSRDRILGSIPTLEIESSGRYLGANSKPDPRDRQEIEKFKKLELELAL